MQPPDRHRRGLSGPPNAFFGRLGRGPIWLVLALFFLVPLAARDAAAQSGFGGNRAGKAGSRESGKGMAKVMERLRAKLEVSNEQEWAIIQQRLERVFRAQREVQNGVFTKKPGAAAAGESDAVRLRRQLEAKAPSREIRASVSRVRELLKQKQGELETAQEDLRSVLTPRQEAIALLNGWLR